MGQWLVTLLPPVQNYWHTSNLEVRTKEVRIGHVLRKFTFAALCVPEFNVETLIIYKHDSNQDCTFALILLIKIVLCSKIIEPGL